MVEIEVESGPEKHAPNHQQAVQGLLREHHLRNIAVSVPPPGNGFISGPETNATNEAERYIVQHLIFPQKTLIISGHPGFEKFRIRPLLTSYVKPPMQTTGNTA